MKAQIIRAFGTVAVFEEAEVAQPIISANQVLVRVAATSINPVDCLVRAGTLAWAVPPLPAILHGDIAGTVVATGANVSEIKVGDEIYAYNGGVLGFGGGLGEFVALDAGLVVPKPATLTMVQAAALPTVGLTAWLALVERAKVQKHQTVLIQGGTGGVGHIAVQLAKHLGATVFATVSSDEKGVVAKELGADVVINYRTESVVDYVKTYTGGRGFDIVFDTVGGDSLRNSLEAAAFGGKVIAIAVGGTYDLTPLLFKTLSLEGVAILPQLLAGDYGVYQRVLKELAKVVEEGGLKPLIDPHAFTLATVSQAHAFFETGQAAGKIVVEIS